MGALGMAVMEGGKPAALTQLLPLSGWFGENNMVLCISESEATCLRGLNKQVCLHLYCAFLPLRPMHVLTLLFVAPADKMNCNYTSQRFLTSSGCSVRQQARTAWLLTVTLTLQFIIFSWTSDLGSWSNVTKSFHPWIGNCFELHYAAVSWVVTLKQVYSLV